MSKQASTIFPPSLHLVPGKIIDVQAGPKAYTVRLNHEATVQCSAMDSTGSTQTLSAKQLTVYPVDTDVIVAIPVSYACSKDGGYTYTLCPPGYIVGSLASPMGSSSLRICDWVGLPTGADAMNDPCQQLISNDPRQFRDYNMGLPLDAIAGSDSGTINEFGVGSGVSRWFSWIRASDIAGLWCFYFDNLVRLSSYNFEQWTAGGEHSIKNDEGEVNDVELFTPYPWEAEGLTRPGSNRPFDTVEGGGRYKKDQYKLSLEPRYADQTILPRYMNLKGYLGDAHREMVVLPHPDFTGGTEDQFVERTSHKTKYTGVLDVHQHSSGLYSIRSAQGLVFEKYIYIPVPKQIAAPEEADKSDANKQGGDGATNYSPAGFWGKQDQTTLAAHDKQPWPWTMPDRSDMWAAEYFDYSAYMFNWYGLKPLTAHKYDWYIVESGFFNNEAAPSGVYLPEKLSGSFNFPLPQFASVKIDHRKGDTKYFYSRSVMAQLPDGSILIEDGYGSAIHMTGGNIHITCAGDVWMRPGRSSITWAGDDIVSRAGSSIDITASNADVRIKAERNMHVLAGNATTGVGGILLESRSVYTGPETFVYRNVVGEDVCSYGVVIKSPNAPVMVYGQDIYGRATSSGTKGSIELEADNGIVMSGTEHLTYAETGISHVIGQKINAGGTLSDSIVNRFDKDNAIIGATKLFRTPAAVVVMDSPDGIYSTGVFACTGGIVPFPGDTTAVINGFTTDYSAWLVGPFTGMLTAYYADVYGELKSNPDFYNYYGFTCRNEAQYGLYTDFLIPEARWQSSYRVMATGLLWNEPAVLIAGTTEYTRPHPGNTMWLLTENYMEYDEDLIRWSNGSGEAGAPCDIERALGGTNSNEYIAAYTARTLPATSQAFKARFMALGYLVSKQYGQT